VLVLSDLKTKLLTMKTLNISKLGMLFRGIVEATLDLFNKGSRIFTLKGIDGSAALFDHLVKSFSSLSKFNTLGLHLLLTSKLLLVVFVVLLDSLDDLLRGAFKIIHSQVGVIVLLNTSLLKLISDLLAFIKALLVLFLDFSFSLLSSLLEFADFVKSLAE